MERTLPVQHASHRPLHLILLLIFLQILAYFVWLVIFSVKAVIFLLDPQTGYHQTKDNNEREHPTLERNTATSDDFIAPTATANALPATSAPVFPLPEVESDSDMESATLISFGQSQPRWVFGMFGYLDDDEEFLSNGAPSSDVSSTAAEMASGEATFECDDFDRPSTSGCIEVANDEPETSSADMHIVAKPATSLSSADMHTKDTPQLEEQIQEQRGFVECPIQFRARSPYTIFPNEDVDAPTIIVTMPFVQDDLTEAFSIWANQVGSPTLSPPGTHLAVPGLPIEWITKRPPTSESKDGKCDPENLSSGLINLGPALDDWDDPAREILVFYRRLQALILDSEDGRLAPHIVISRPYGSPYEDASARDLNKEPYVTNPIYLQVHSSLYPATVHDWIYTRRESNSADDGMSDADSTAPGTPQSASLDLSTLEAEVSFKTTSDPRSLYHIDEDDEPLGDLPSW